MAQYAFKDILFNRRVMIILFMGFSSGLPLALTGSTLQAWYTVSGVPLITIGALSLIGQPYIYKFLWAPLLDRFSLFRIGRRRSWIVLMQLALAVTLIVMAFLHPQSQPWVLAFAAMGVALFSATQDTAIDAYRTDILKVEERGLGASLNTIGYRFAMIFSGAIALIFAAEIGWRDTYIIMAIMMLLNAGMTLYAPSPQFEMHPPTSLTKAVVEPWKEFMTRKNAILILVFIVIYKLCDAFALSLNTTFLLRGIGFSLVDVGSISKVVGLVAALAGSFIGGALLPYMGLYRSLMIFGFLQMVSNLSFALLAVIGKNYLLMAGSIFAENFCGGLSTVAFVVFLMSLCDKRYTATQYALLSALTAVGRVFVGPEAAVMVSHMGWAEFYVWTFFMGLPALAILWWLNRRIDFAADQLARAA